MKILFFSLELIAGHFIESQVEQLAKKHSVIYLHLNTVKKEVFTFKHKQIILDKHPVLDKINGFLERHDISYKHIKKKQLRKKLTIEIDDFSPDIIYCQFAYDALWMLENYYDPQKKYVVHIRGYDVSNKLMSKCYVKRLQFFLKKKNIFVFSVCQYLLDNLEYKYISLANPATIIYSNTDVRLYKRIEDPPVRPFVFTQVSSFRKKKGHVYSLHAIKKFIETANLYPYEVKFVFTGYNQNNEDAQAIFSLANSLNIANYISFSGWLSSEEIRDLLSQSHVIHQHSITTLDNDQEGIPNALMEGMAMELPVISTIHAGIPELLSEFTDCQLVKERDIDSYAKAFFDIYYNWQLSSKNRNHVVKYFSSSNFDKKIDLALKRVIEL